MFLISLFLCSFANGSERLELYSLSQRMIDQKIMSIQDAIQFNAKSRSLGFEGITTFKPGTGLGACHSLFLAMKTTS